MAFKRLALLVALCCVLCLNAAAVSDVYLVAEDAAPPALAVPFSVPRDGALPSSAPLGYCCYVTCSTSQLGNITFFVPVTYREGYLSMSDNGLMNVHTSSVSGYFYRGSTLYQIRFSGYATPQYRVYDSGYSYTDLTVDEVLSTNMVIYDSYNDVAADRSDIYLLGLLLVGGVIVVCLFMRR